MSEKHSYGGQAVLEGVMMRGRKGIAVAVRKPDGQISMYKKLMKEDKKPALFKMPVIRGVVNFVETLVIGMDALMFSANEATGQDEKLTSWEVALTLLASFGLFVGLFIVLPNVLVSIISRYFASIFVINLIEGAFRLAIFGLYLYGISYMKDIKRLFAYHGAEHKVIAAYEAEEPLDTEHIQAHTTMHTRCGTNFLLIVMFVSILIYSMLGRQTILARIATRIVLLPVIAGLAYELFKLAAKKRDSAILRAVSYPGLQLQKLTTKQPDNDMVEVALAAFKGALEMDGEPVTAIEAGTVQEG
jgi:uncharacterized protein YqhQ